MESEPCRQWSRFGLAWTRLLLLLCLLLPARHSLAQPVSRTDLLQLESGTFDFATRTYREDAAMLELWRQLPSRVGAPLPAQPPRIFRLDAAIGTGFAITRFSEIYSQGTGATASFVEASGRNQDATFFAGLEFRPVSRLRLGLEFNPGLRQLPTADGSQNELTLPISGSLEWRGPVSLWLAPSWSLSSTTGPVDEESRRRPALTAAVFSRSPLGLSGLRLELAASDLYALYLQEGPDQEVSIDRASRSVLVSAIQLVPLTDRRYLLKGALSGGKQSDVLLSQTDTGILQQPASILQSELRISGQARLTREFAMGIEAFAGLGRQTTDDPSATQRLLREGTHLYLRALALEHVSLLVGFDLRRTSSTWLLTREGLYSSSARTQVLLGGEF